jgi:outer membrane protein OmpA-like peptidoglycan-associated protein
MKAIKFHSSVLIFGLFILVLASGCATKKEARVEKEPEAAESTIVEKKEAEVEVKAKEEAPEEVPPKETPKVEVVEETPKKEATKEKVEEKEPAVVEKKEAGEVTVAKKVEVVTVKDSDRDGVPDDYDMCPGTPLGVKVDVHGCPEVTKKRETFEYTLEFDIDSAQIRQVYFKEIQKAVDFMKSHSGVEVEKVIIEGHADSTGSYSYNDTLSHKRALSVKEFIVKNLKIDPDVIEINAYGERKPIATNKTKEGRQRNRRVVVTFIVWYQP